MAIFHGANQMRVHNPFPFDRMIRVTQAAHLILVRISDQQKLLYKTLIPKCGQFTRWFFQIQSVYQHFLPITLLIQYMGLCVFSLPISPVMIERIYILFYYHNQIGSMNYYPLFRDTCRSWNNGMRCMSLYILRIARRTHNPEFIAMAYTPCLHWAAFEQDIWHMT